MHNLQDALIKAKLAKEEQRQTTAVAEPLKQEIKQQYQQPARLTAPEFEKFETLFCTEKSKPFAIHLLHGFLPFPDNDYIWGWEDKKWKNGKKCCICGLETLSRDDLFKNIDKQTEASMEGMIRSVKEENFNVHEFLKSKKQEMFGDRLMGVTSEKTSCILCAPCYEIFSNWVPTRMLYDDSFAKLITKVRLANTFKQHDIPS